MNLFIVFTISGLWHGANWTFIIWGALNGFYLVFALITKNLRDRVNRFLGAGKFPALFKISQIAITFALTCFAWIFFRANTVHDAFFVVRSIFSLQGDLFLDKTAVIYGFNAILILIAIEIYQEYYKIHLPFKSRYSLKNQIAYCVLAIAIVALGVFDGSQFIYFQF